MTRDARSGLIELVEEQLEIGKREVERGRAVVRTRVEERNEVAEIELQQEDVSVERIRRGVPVETLPVTREEDGVLIIPVVEEQLVVTTRLILKEEIRITRRSRTELVREPVRLRCERVDIERLEGRATPVSNTDLTEGVPTMTDRTLTAMYDTRDEADEAQRQLVGLGIPSDEISIHGGETGTAAETAEEEPGFWASLFMPDADRQMYAEGVQRGGYLLTVEVQEDLQEAALDVLEGSGAVDLDAQAATWRQDGWQASGAGDPAVVGAVSGAAAATTGMAETDAAYRPEPRADVRSLGGHEVIQAAEEQLVVGKREVGRGGVRVRSYVTERPVEEQVELRQERVSVERRPVNRELAPGDAAFQERTIEAVERGEEAVVSKTARVTEEIGIRKDVEHETEMVRDTVRKQEVEVEDDRRPRKPTGTGTVVEDSVVDPDLAGTSR